MNKTALLAIAATAAFGASSTALAYGHNGFGLYVGVKGGYNQMNSPKQNIATSIGFPNSAELTRDDYVANAHFGYLYDVNSHLDIGPQFGYSYYGKYRMLGTNGATGGTSRRVESLNVQGVIEINMHHLYVRGRGGAGYFKTYGQGTISKTTNLRLSDTDEWLTIAGASLGYHFTPHFSVALFYDHVFGDDLDSLSKLQSKGVPVMNSGGISFEYAFSHE